MSVKKLLLMSMLLVLVACGSSEDEMPVQGSGKIIGTVIDASTGDGISTANVRIDPTGKSTVTGSDGMFSFYDLAAGDYTITVYKEGYISTETTVKVSKGITEAQILLDRKSATLKVEPAELDFGEKLNTLSFKLVNSNYGGLDYRIDTGDCLWLSTDPTEGVVDYGKTTTVVVNIDRERLANGDNTAKIIVHSVSGKGSAEITVKAYGEYRAEAVVNTLDVEVLSASSVKMWGEIVNEGTPKYTERGFVWGTSDNPSTSSNAQREDVTITSDKEFALVVTGMKSNTRYYVQSYVKQKNKYIYGNVVSFSTSQQKTQITTQGASQVTSNSAVLNGYISDEGNPAYTERGFCYAYQNYHDPTITDHKVIVTGRGTGNYSTSISGLEINTRYRYRAYAIQDGKPVYGETVYFNTSFSKSSVDTSEPQIKGYDVVTFVGNVRSVGEPAYTERGFCYVRGTSTPRINDNKVSVWGNGSGSYSTEVKGLEEGCTYSVRAYVIQSGDVIYGNTKYFDTPYAPLCVTFPALNVKCTDGFSWEAFLRGAIGDGDPEVTEWGFVYDTNYNPTLTNGASKIQGYKTDENDSAYLIERKVTGLMSYKTYYYRIYAKTKYGTFYGENESFSTM